MSDKPPGEGDPLLQEILRQLKDSFADVDQNPFLDSDLLDVLSQELSTSIDALIKKEKTSKEPIISVVDGGLTPSDETSVDDEQVKPQLHIANPKDYSLENELQVDKTSNQQSEVEGDSGLLSSLFGAQMPDVEVRVFGPDDFDKIRSELHSKDLSIGEEPIQLADQPLGSIMLGSGEQQLIFKGQQHQIYRIYVEEGELLIFDGDEEITRIRAGQSCDVEGIHVYVKALIEPSEGSYHRMM